MEAKFVRRRPVSGRTIFVQKQLGNSPYGARECDVTEALIAREQSVREP